MTQHHHSQIEQRFTRPKTPVRLKPDEIVVDLFAGGGGASHALESALGRPVDIAINHNPWAVAMHAANHPDTCHFCEDIRQVSPRLVVGARRIGWLHASPDCTHFSQARGGQPRCRATRALSWAVLHWAGTVRPRIISLENVKEILKWGPLIARRDPTCGRVMKLDGTVAAPGERVPVDQQFLIPDKRHQGRTWNRFVAALHAKGYVVQWRKLVASDFGAGTRRERLFLLARRDGLAISWPEPTHHVNPVPAAASIDFDDLGRSIFGRTRPLAAATLRRIARGVVRHVIQAAEPFFLTNFANTGNGGRTWSVMEPLRTQCAGVKGGHFALVMPVLVPNNTNNAPKPVSEPLPTAATCQGRNLLVSAFLEQACAGYYTGSGHDLRKPVPTICARGSIQRMVTCELSPEQSAGTERVAAFLVNYYGTGTVLDQREPLATITTNVHSALVTVTIHGQPYVITDIKLRMLKPAELFRAQGFPPDYIIDRTVDGRAISRTNAIRMVGNSVSPPPLRAIVAANLYPVGVPERRAA